MLPAAVAYAGYLSFQWMSEPGWLSLLMNRTAPQRQSGASAWNFFVVFSTHAVAATVFGAAVTRLGYARPLLAVGLLGLLSAVVFRRLLGETASEIAAKTSAR
jgi:predicted MFS family arabinose efflux permease